MTLCIDPKLHLVGALHIVQAHETLIDRCDEVLRDGTPMKRKGLFGRHLKATWLDFKRLFQNNGWHDNSNTISHKTGSTEVDLEER